ncbi:MAG: cupin domain-containing protein, partial [Acidaminococcaceae bacterium]|nr:cupin domain-containing protein [Acidaminococcaceae bacterium]
MRFDFKTMEEKALPHFKGGEKELNAKMYVDANNKILLGRLVPGATVGEHQHESSSEIIYGLS